MIQPSQEEFLHAIDRTDKLAPAPRTLGRALHLLRDPESGIDAITKLISSDSALAVDVLRCANSAYYGRGSRIANVAEAVQIIGFHETFRLVSVVAVHHTTNRPLGNYGIAARDFWAESLINGLFLELLAKRTRGADPGEAYTTGLLRFVGRIAIDQVLDHLGGNLFWDGKKPLSEWERENVGFAQAAIGGRLLRRWEFPDQIVLALEIQDASIEDGIGAAPALAQCMHFAVQVLPPGTSQEAIMKLGDSPAVFPSTHPFSLSHQVTIELVTDLLLEARHAFIAITEGMYR